MCGFTKQQARSVIDKMRSEKLINLNGEGTATRYVIFNRLNILASRNRDSGAVETYIPDTETAFDWLNYHS